MWRECVSYGQCVSHWTEADDRATTKRQLARQTLGMDAFRSFVDIYVSNSTDKRYFAIFRPCSFQDAKPPSISMTE